MSAHESFGPDAEPDKDMTAEQLDVARQFTDRLVKLGALSLSPSPTEIKAITPLLFYCPRWGSRTNGGFPKKGVNTFVVDKLSICQGVNRFSISLLGYSFVVGAHVGVLGICKGVNRFFIGFLGNSVVVGAHVGILGIYQGVNRFQGVISFVVGVLGSCQGVISFVVGC
jgi:hypothetical protein